MNNILIFYSQTCWSDFLVDESLLKHFSPKHLYEKILILNQNLLSIKINLLTFIKNFLWGDSKTYIDCFEFNLFLFLTLCKYFSTLIYFLIQWFFWTRILSFIFRITLFLVYFSLSLKENAQAERSRMFIQKNHFRKSESNFF